MPQHVGVDGCRAGWLAVTRRGPELAWQVFSTFDDLASAFSDAERIFIDIPIGLPWEGAPVRPCDRLARQILGKPRMSSVFPVPCRQALAATGLAEAREINNRCIQRSIGAQTWCISPKIREVDTYLLSHDRDSSSARSSSSTSTPSSSSSSNRSLCSLADIEGCRGIREIHPEVCFWLSRAGSRCGTGRPHAKVAQSA